MRDVSLKMSSVPMESVRNIAVTSTSVCYTDVDLDHCFPELLTKVIFRETVSPNELIGEKRVGDFIQEQICLNSVTATTSKYVRFVPQISLAFANLWASRNRSGKDSVIARYILGLYSAACELFDRNQSKRFEELTTFFLLLKLQLASLKETHLRLLPHDGHKSLLPEMTICFGESVREISLDSAHQLYHGSFCNGKFEESKYHDEDTKNTRRIQIRGQRIKELPNTLQLPAMIVAPSQNQAFAEKVLVFEDKASKETHLLFLQDKYYHEESKSPKPLTGRIVADALENLVKMRHILFSIPNGCEPGNQISALRVKEVNVTLLFLSLAELEPKADTWKKDDKPVNKAIAETGFQGSIVICDGTAISKLFGDSFKWLPLLDAGTFGSSKSIDSPKNERSPKKSSKSPIRESSKSPKKLRESLKNERSSKKSGKSILDFFKKDLPGSEQK